jgi:hypothetical protein
MTRTFLADDRAEPLNERSARLCRDRPPDAPRVTHLLVDDCAPRGTHPRRRVPAQTAGSETRRRRLLAVQRGWKSRFEARATRTSHVAARTTASATLPTRRRMRPERPWVPSTSRSTFRRAASAKMTARASPGRTCGPLDDGRRRLREIHRRENATEGFGKGRHLRSSLTLTSKRVSLLTRNIFSADCRVAAREIIA